MGADGLSVPLEVSGLGSVEDRAVSPGRVFQPGLDVLDEVGDHRHVHEPQRRDHLFGDGVPYGVQDPRMEGRVLFEIPFAGGGLRVHGGHGRVEDGVLRSLERRDDVGRDPQVEVLSQRDDVGQGIRPGARGERGAENERVDEGAQGHVGDERAAPLMDAHDVEGL